MKTHKKKSLYFGKINMHQTLKLKSTKSDTLLLQSPTLIFVKKNTNIIS
jgi:hypothetical protein